MFRVENLKRFITELFMGLVFLMVILIIPAIGETHQHNYSQICEVYEVTDTTTTFVDPVGYLWDVNDTEYVKGETVKVYFFDNFTDFNREDDIIKKVKKVVDK